MPDSPDQRILLLPERRRFAGQAMAAWLAQRLGRSDRLADVAAGEQAQLQRHFEVSPAGWPMAAICRQAESGDAQEACWLRADPAFVRPDINGVRLMGWGNLGLSAAESDALLEALQPTFEEAGLRLSATSPVRWYLRLPADALLPAFAAPSEALGEDLLAHLPEGETGRRWRGMINDAQIILHNHPLNAGRATLGLPAVNSLWFWGGGRLPGTVTASVRQLRGGDVELRALALAAGLPLNPAAPGSMLLDLRRERDWATVERGPLCESMAAIDAGEGSVLLDFADGARWRLGASQRWRIWRRPLSGLGQ